MFRLFFLTNLFGIIILSQLFAQRTDILENLEVFEIDGKVQISATVKSGYSCLGMNFLRTEDTTVLFQSIGSIEGVCGNSTQSMRYDFIDENPPKNSIIYYRVQLGGVGYSEILSIIIYDTGNARYLVMPNPAKNSCRIYFNNEFNKSHRLRLVNQFGLELLNSESSNDIFQLNLKDFTAGVYHFIVYESTNLKPKFFGKLSVY
jgi:hypothetical protein